MRIAIISDVHGNLTAMDAVLDDLRRQKPDVVFHGGDLALGGCNPAEVIDRIAQEGWAGVVGNTDEMLWTSEARPALEAAAPRLQPLFRALFDLFAPATRALIGEARMAWLRQQPAELRFENLALVHASPGNLWRAPLGSAADSELEDAYKVLQTPIVVYCHIHRPFVRKAGSMTVCNCGSVGAPYDGDPRASYLLIDDGKASIRRVEYDVEIEAGRLLASDYPGRQWQAEMRRRGSYLPPPNDLGA